jgi:hypothetical protein
MEDADFNGLLISAITSTGTTRKISRERNMAVAFASLHQCIRYRNEDTRLYVAALADRSMFSQGVSRPFLMRGEAD